MLGAFRLRVVRAREETTRHRTQDLAEREAAEARTDVDEQWSAYLRSLQVTREIDAVMIGGENGPAPCPLCNGKGVRVMFGKESKCEWCDGQGFVDGGAV